MTPPEWLTRHGGDIKLASDGRTWHVLLGPEPQYSLWTTPVSGKHGCALRHNNSGRRIPCSATFASSEEALKGGLEELRRSLGW